MKKNWHFIMSFAFLMSSLSVLSAEEVKVEGSVPAPIVDEAKQETKTADSFVLTNDLTDDSNVADEEMDQEEENIPSNKETVLDWDRVKPKEPTAPNSCGCQKKKGKADAAASDEEEDEEDVEE